MSSTEQLLPNYAKLDTALRSIGYSFETAVADVVDNSIDAQASKILIRLIFRRDGKLDLAICDDGLGMNEATLKEAMRFGSDVSKELRRLGKFGLGLKLASLSQARELKVISAREGKIVGRAWTEGGIAEGFSSTIFGPGECRSLIANAVPEWRFSSSATLVLWSDLFKVGAPRTDMTELAQKLLRRLETHLALSFHRFLSGRARGRTKKLEFQLDIFDRETRQAGIPKIPDALNPFGYGASGKEGFPMRVEVDGPYRDRLSINAHIWPPNSTDANYRLPGGANSRQGFYFYRNDRLIQAGGWNGLREAEPHSSLARVEVDIADDFDVDVSLDVKKVEIQLPPPLAVAIQKSKNQSGVDFKKYLSAADEVYRTRSLAEAELPLIPSSGLPADLIKYLTKELRLKTTAKFRKLKIGWKRFDDSIFFDIDKDLGHLYLNISYRKDLLHGVTGSSADIPVIKCLLFLVLGDALSSARIGARIREKVEQANRILVRAVRYERR